jgi:hypothetical protein
MTAGNVADGKGHRKNGQPECERYPKKPDTHIREGSRQDSTAAASQYQPESSEKLCSQSSLHLHSSLYGW